MAQTVQRTQVTPADELRDLLEMAEKRVANSRSSGDSALALLNELDRIAELWPQLEGQGMDLRPEAGRWNTLQASVLRKASGLLGQLQKVGGISALRAQQHPEGTDAPWWHLDRHVAQTRKRQWRRVLTIAGAVVAVALVAWFLYQRFFPVDPKVAESYRRVGKGEQLILQDNDWRGALAEFQAASVLTPDDYNAWLRVGVAEEQLGDASAAQEAWQRGRALLPVESDFLKGRAAAYLLFDLIDLADRDIQAALKLKNDDAQAWYQAASVYEARNQVEAAVDALDKASTYAEQTHQDELTALARYRMGMLMQRAAMPQLSATPAP